MLVLPSAPFTPLPVSTHSTVWFVIFGIPQAVLTACAFAMVTPVLQAVCPYRLRGLGVAMGVMYVVLIGGVGRRVPPHLFPQTVWAGTTSLLLPPPPRPFCTLLFCDTSRRFRPHLSPFALAGLP